MILAVLAGLALVTGALALYLASPHQSLTANNGGGTMRIAGLIALALALVLLLASMGPATAVFTWLTGLMLLWSLPPVVIGWLRYLKGRRS